MSALPLKADIVQHPCDVQLRAKADIEAAFGYYCWWGGLLKLVERHP
jgi:hypothetical protein